MWAQLYKPSAVVDVAFVLLCFILFYIIILFHCLFQPERVRRFWSIGVEAIFNFLLKDPHFVIQKSMLNMTNVHLAYV